MQSSADMSPWNTLDAGIMDTDKYLSSANAPDLEEDVRLCITSGAREMIINCAPLTYMTAAGLHAFMNMARMMRDAGGTLKIVGLTGQPREIFDACGMDMVIPPADSATHALAAIHAA
jgi:anti-sigma B factor antagonist